ncbi:MAG: DUF3035 domain-containing protein [Oceanicaulis sp.]|nr:DUF3035 domain-containing protein [Oceanicaulis sp.]
MRTALIISAAALIGASACNTGVRQALGAEKTVPDEFRVVTIAPLTVPPEYNLRPPRPGELRSEDIFQDQAARRALFGDLSASTATDAEILFAQRAGAADAIPDVRALIDGETAAIVRKPPTIADRILFWRDNERMERHGRDPVDFEDELTRAAAVTGGGEVQITRERRRVRPKLPGL